MQEEIRRQKLKKAKADFKHRGSISECFYADKTQCKGEIKQSHSIQRNKRLSIIEGQVNGQNVVYTFTEMDFDENGKVKTLKPIGKKSASTFFGFCDYHDTHLFSPIENSEFDDSDKHCFLHSYRSFAHSYHIKKESLKAYNSLLAASDSYYDRMELTNLVNGTELAMKELEIDKQTLDEWIQNKNYSKLEYFTYTLPDKFPIACSSIINPEYSYKNKSINNNPLLKYSTIMLTVLPDFDKTIIIIACFPQDAKGIMLLDELNEIKYQLPFEKAISSLIINNAENTFLSPQMWNTFGTEGQKQLCSELDDVIRVAPRAFVHSKINFFDKKFSAAKLKV